MSNLAKPIREVFRRWKGNGLPGRNPHRHGADSETEHRAVRHQCYPMQNCDTLSSKEIQWFLSVDLIVHIASDGDGKNESPLVRILRGKL